MPYSDESYNLRIELDTKNCTLSPAEIEKLERDLDPLADVVRDFPVSDLYITISHHPRSNDYQVKTALVLTGRTLFAGDTDAALHPVYERCIHKLIKRASAYKEQMANKPELAKQEKGTRQDVQPTALPPQPATIDAAVQEGDYRRFRAALQMFEEPVRKRIGRWVQRYPEVEAEIDRRIAIADIVEEVFLTAFEEYDRRPLEAAPGEWLEMLIDPALKELVRHFDEEIENINFVRTMNETSEPSPEP